jgi:hypothetical protein
MFKTKTLPCNQLHQFHRCQLHPIRCFNKLITEREQDGKRDGIREEVKLKIKVKAIGLLW